MKLYTEEQLIELTKAAFTAGQNHNSFVFEDEFKKHTPIELPSDEEIFWNTENPIHIDNYIVHRGAEGVSLGRWNGEEWIEMWGSKKLNVYGWIKIPNTPIEWMRDKILNK